MSVGATSEATRGIPQLDDRFHERLFENAGIAIFACDTDGLIRGASRAGRELLAAHVGETRGASERVWVRDLLPAEDHATLAQSLQTCISTREPLEFRTRLTAARETTEYAAWLTPLLAADGTVQGVAIWLHDITARVRVRRNLRKSERLNSLGAMSGAAAHHYNNILCGLATSLEFAMNMNTMTAMRRALQRTAEAVSRATELTQQLLAFAQADHRCADYCDLTEIVMYHFDEKEAWLRQHNVTVDFAWQPAPMLPVPREPLLLILRNLTENAVEAMPAGGRLSVTLAREGERSLRLTLTDSGPGLNPEQIEHLFEPFYTTRGELCAGGMRKAGMGLAVVYGLVSDLDGVVTAGNVPGAGARFDVVLPYPADAGAPPGA